jgi:hypothetical protein
MIHAEESAVFGGYCLVHVVVRDANTRHDISDLRAVCCSLIK